MPQTYRYLVNPDGSKFDEAKIKWPAGIGTWPPQTSDSIIALVTNGSLIDDGVNAVKAAYPEAEVFGIHGDAVKAAIASVDDRIVLQPIHLGKGEEGQRRKAALEKMASDDGCFWNGKPSIGRWLVALADRELTA